MKNDTRCRICHALINQSFNGRCRCRQDVKDAADLGLSYGQYKAIPFEALQRARELEARRLAQEKALAGYIPCPTCGKLFKPYFKGQLACSCSCGKAYSWKLKKEGKR